MSSKEEILDRFETRVRDLIKHTLTPEDRIELEGVYLSTYECYSTITEDLPNNHRKCNSAVVLMRILREYGINIEGVTSERKVNGEYLTSVRSSKKVVYIGKHSYFSGNTSHKWRLLPIDKAKQ